MPIDRRRWLLTATRNKMWLPKIWCFIAMQGDMMKYGRQECLCCLCCAGGCGIEKVVYCFGKRYGKKTRSTVEAVWPWKGRDSLKQLVQRVRYSAMQWIPPIYFTWKTENDSVSIGICGKKPPSPPILLNNAHNSEVISGGLASTKQLTALNASAPGAEFRKGRSFSRWSLLPNQDG